MSDHNVSGERAHKEVLDDYGMPTWTRSQSTLSFLRRRRWNLARDCKIPAMLTIIFLVLLLLWKRPRPPAAPLTDWSRFAYTQYATDDPSMCNAYMVFEALQRLDSKAERVLLYPEEWDRERNDPSDRTKQLLLRAKRHFGVKLKPIQLLSVTGPASPPPPGGRSNSDTSITKLRVFELDSYARVLHLDNDITLLQNLDELFLLPRAPIAMPRMYWADQNPNTDGLMTSMLMLVEPNAAETRNLYDLLQSWRPDNTKGEKQKYDMDLLNERFGSSAMVLPQRPYALLTGEFRKHNHDAYMGTSHAPGNIPRWDARRAIKEAKVVHFSDWPLPKPWVMGNSAAMKEMQPDCDGQAAGCPERDVWYELYDDFRLRRKDLCKLLSEPGPRDWEKYKNSTRLLS